MSMKFPVTPVGFEQATFRFVAQLLNHCATAVYTVCTRINYKTVPVTNFNKHLHYGTSGNEYVYKYKWK